MRKYFKDFSVFLIITTLLGFSSWAYSEGMTGGGPGMTGQSGFQAIYRSNEYRLMDTDRTHYLRIIAGSDLTANRLLTLTTGDAARTITLSGNPTLADWFDQAVKSTSSPIFVTAKLSGLTDGYVPYHATDATGLADTTLYFSGTNLFLGDTANTKSTAGFTINQGASDDEIISLKSSDVGHSFTTDTEADTYALFKKLSATLGGLNLTALSDGDATAFSLTAAIGSTNPTDTTPAAIINCGKLSGTTVGALGDAETCFQVQNNGTVLETTLGNGNKGIGTTTPGAKLEINGLIKIQGGSGSIGNSLLFYNTAGDNYVQLRAEGGAGVNDFVVRTDSEVARFTEGGNVGIKTTGPIYTVDSAGAINSRIYYSVEEFDDEVTGTQFESGHRANAWVTAGTNYAAGNVTYTAGPGGTLKVMNAAADNDSVTSLGVLNANVTQNPIMEVRVKIDTKETAAFYVGFASAAFADVNGAFPADAFLVGINSDNGHGFGATRIVAASVDAEAAVDYDDMGAAIVSDTFVKIKIDLTDTEQPRVWINDTEVTAGNITGTVQTGVALAPYFMVQNLAGGAIQRFITLDYFKMWQDR